MRKRFRWIQELAAGTALAVLSAVAGAQEPAPQGYGQEAGDQPPLYVASNTAAADPAPDLAGRVAELEKALKKRADADDAAKKAAALKPTCVPGGMIQMDTNVFNQDAGSLVQFPKGTDVRNATGFRRARINLSGEMFSVFDYKIEVDFAGTASALTGLTTTTNPVTGDIASVTGTTGTLQQTTFKDVYMGVHELPWIGNIRAGHFKEPFGLEELTSDRFITFLERSLADEGAIVPARNLGVMAHNWSEDQRLTWASGVFASEKTVREPPIYQENTGGAAWTSRVTFLPWYDEASGGRGLLHTGVAYSFRESGTHNLTYSARPEAFFGPRVVSITMADVESSQLLGAEAAYVYGPFSVQSEYFQTFVDRTANENVTFNGGYIYCSYFLTGENRTYSRKNGCFDRVVPYTNFFRVRDCDGCTQTGWGAWEVGYRYSILDLNDGRVTGGEVHDHTVGVNWYMNPYTRLMWNYVVSDVNRTRNGATDGVMGIFEMRAAMDF